MRQVSKTESTELCVCLGSILGRPSGRNEVLVLKSSHQSFLLKGHCEKPEENSTNVNINAVLSEENFSSKKLAAIFTDVYKINIAPWKHVFLSLTPHLKWCLRSTQALGSERRVFLFFFFF